MYQECTISMVKSDAVAFYAVHKERPFYGELIAFMTSAPAMVQMMNFAHVNVNKL